MRRTVLLLSAAVTLVAATAASAATGPGAGLAAVTPVPAQSVGTDPLGDWGGGGDAAAVGHTLGQDLLGASIGMPSADRVDFVLDVSFLPSPGGVPEASRYTWDFLVGKTQFQLDGKFTNYSRGACDPTSGQCPPPRDPGPAPFLLRGDCTVTDGNVTVCRELAAVEGVFNPTRRTITIPVPTELLGLVPCSTIAGGANLFGGSISATPSAFFTTSSMPMDTMSVGTFRVPSADPDTSPCPAT